MPRRQRFYSPGIEYHVAQFVPKQTPCFYKNNDYEKCLRFLTEASLDYDCKVHAYAFLPFGLHLLLAPNDKDGISRFMQSLARRYVAYVNNEYRRTGPLWTQRYKASAIDSENYHLLVSQYIEYRPIELSNTESLQSFHWSSFPCHAYGKNDDLITLHREYLQLGREPAQRQMAYRRQTELPRESSIRQNIQSSLSLGLPLGSSQFKKKLANTLNVRALTFYPKRGLKRDELHNHRTEPMLA